MAFPTIDMKGYGRLRERIVFALDRCQEQQWLDFKESRPWPELKWRLLRTIMGMANLRDGGLIVIGVSERDDTWDLTGISSNDLSEVTPNHTVSSVSIFSRCSTGGSKSRISPICASFS